MERLAVNNMVTGGVDIKGFQDSLTKYKLLTGKGWETIVKDQARLAAVRLMQLTPPTDKAQGAKRVAIDIGRVYLANEWFETKFSFRNQKLDDRVKNAVRAKDTGTLEAIFAKSSKLDRLHLEPFDASKHKAARRKGRVGLPEPYSFPLTEQQQLKVSAEETKQRRNR